MASSRVYIGRLARDATKRDLERLFKNYGDIREINVKTGFGFVEFSDERDAKDVVYDFHGKSFLGERLIVEIARGARRNDERRNNGNDRRRSHYRLIVENIASGTNWQDLKDMMRKAGEVTFADISRDRPTEGIVEFAVRDDMEYALKKLNDRELNGQRVTLREDTGRNDRSSGRSSARRSRSQSKSRSRSPPRRRRRSPSESRSRSPPRRRRRSPSQSRSRSASRSRSPPRKREKRDSSDREDSRDRRRNKSESRSRSRSPAKSAGSAQSPARSPAQSPARSEGSAPRED
ncbi:Sorting nexin mvp1 [Mucor velutinosus]|uniref:Sorting nexin mvp1 n=1 Tax=Mucor velutinosus TaxID=708070 RepID=A0AAN7DN49_9FUNG|nr:Sorting nexin mvp1 [Mucor velutinosus]